MGKFSELVLGCPFRDGSSCMMAMLMRLCVHMREQVEKMVSFMLIFMESTWPLFDT
jgi:hypothetical protein